MFRGGFQEVDNAVRNRLMKFLGVLFLCSGGLPLAGKLVFAAEGPQVPTVPAAPEGNGKKEAEPAAEAGEGEWQKVETKAKRLSNPREMLSPGLFDSSLQHIVTFPKDGSAVDIGLPHAGKDAAGKDRPPLMARLKQGFVFVDATGEAKPTADTMQRVSPEGLTAPFNFELHYDDGSAVPYSFCFKTVVEGEKYAIIRNLAHIAAFNGHTLVLFDDNGNGKYDDPEKDALLIDNNPITFVGKYIMLGGQFYELLVHTSGIAIELRPAPKLEVGAVDLFEKYNPSQKGENLVLHTFIVSGPNGSFAGDDKHKLIKAPAGAYDFSFGLFERNKEVVYLKKGEKTSFMVNAKEVATPKWGGVIKAEFEVSSDGQEVTVFPPSFLGQGTELYYPENYRISSVKAGIALVYHDDFLRSELLKNFGGQTFTALPDGSLKPLIFMPYRKSEVTDVYQVGVDYISGIMGNVIGKKRLQFTYKWKEKEKEK